jgi:hypothetical protein
MAGIRLNNPDSAANLIRVEISAKPTALNTGVRYYLRRSSSVIRVWRERERTSAPLLGSTDEIEISEEEIRRGAQLWVENMDEGEVDLILEARRNRDGKVIEFYRTTFRTLRSLVIVIGGRSQNPGLYDSSNPLLCSKDLCGIFAIGEKLYQQGYDVRLFSQEDIQIDGRGAVYDFIQQAVEKRGLHKLAILGYSWGGGALQDLAAALKEDSVLGDSELSYTAYIDAIKTASNFYEQRRPPESRYHLNLYQEAWHCYVILANLCGISNESEIGTVTINIPVSSEEYGDDLVHLTIDDSPAVSSQIIEHLRKQVRP